MISLLKLLGKGLLYTFLFPLGVVFFAIYGIYLLLVWVVMLFRTIVLFLQGKKTGLTLPEDMKAIEILNKSRDWTEPINNQPQNQTGVSYTFNINGAQLDERKGTIMQDKPEVLDYTNEENKEDN